MPREKETVMNYLLLIICMLLYSLAGNACAESCGANIIYEGRGAGQVIFDGALHTSKGLTCSTCHEVHGFSSALFEMKKGANVMSMRKMQLVHPVVTVMMRSRLFQCPITSVVRTVIISR